MVSVKTLSIRNVKYYKDFDDSDNPCCWQVDELTADIDEVLQRQGIEAEVIPDDWGTAYSWRNRDNVLHSMTVTCQDVETVTFGIEYFAFVRKWLIVTKDVPDPMSDFGALIPALRELNEVA